MKIGDTTDKAVIPDSELRPHAKLNTMTEMVLLKEDTIHVRRLNGKSQSYLKAGSIVIKAKTLLFKQTIEPKTSTLYNTCYLWPTQLNLLSFNLIFNFILE